MPDEHNMPTKTAWEALKYNDSIRLLQLQPAKARESTLHGELQMTTLSAYEQDISDQYTAISYVWGDPEQVDEVWLGHTRVGITANLGAVLRDTRDVNKTLTIWVDALCINQDDIPERNQQVRIMGEIYRQASSTIIYLGPTSQDIDLLFDTSIERKRLDPVNYNQPTASIDKKWTFEEDPRLSKAIDDLCSREWFTRSWVFQELVLSKHPRIQCSQRRLQWDTLMPLLQSYSDKQGQCRLALAMDQARGYRNGLSFYDLLVSRAHSKATDPRDFFYSVLGLANDRQLVEKVLPVDYNILPKEVYVRAARYLLQGSCRLEGLFPYCNLSALGEALPSWVPDWGVQTKWLLQPRSLAPNHHVNDSTTHFASELGIIEDISESLISSRDVPPSLRDHAQLLLQSIVDDRGLTKTFHILETTEKRQIQELWPLWDSFVEENDESNVDSWKLQAKSSWPRSPALRAAADLHRNPLVIVQAICECIDEISYYKAGRKVHRLSSVSGMPTLVPFEAKVGDKVMYIDEGAYLVQSVNATRRGSIMDCIKGIEPKLLTKAETECINVKLYRDLIYHDEMSRNVKLLQMLNESWRERLKYHPYRTPNWCYLSVH